MLSRKEIQEISSLSDKIYIDDRLKDYIVKLVRNTRPQTSKLDEIKPYVKHGVSPRASLALLRCARANALLEGRNFVVPEDIRFSIYEVMRHRMILTFEAVSEDVTVDSLIKTILEVTALP